MTILAVFFTFTGSTFGQAEKPLRVFIRAGVKTHGPNQHDHPRFLADWKELLNQRGLKADGAMTFPTAAQLENTDVMIIFAADGMKIVGQERENFEKFLKRGGGFVVLHDGVVSADEHEWAKKIQGGAWVWKDPARPELKSKWYEGEVGIYFTDTTHPITKGISNFDWKDEIYYDFDMAPDAKVLATSFHTVFVIAPQLWTYEKTLEGGKTPYRAFVSLPGHEYASFNTPHYRAILMRGIAWAGKRANVDEFCAKEELASLKYPAGGPTAPDKALAKMNLYPEFTMNLVAAEPLIEKVISLDWDPQGRLWVAETPEYPNGRTINKNDKMIALWAEKDPTSFTKNKEDRPAKDRISWLEDTNGDGVMDKKHVFYEGLELVTSLVFYKDGVIVAQAPDILWIRDTDGDGKADKVEKLFTGFGTGDTHAVINNFRWGMDGWVYGACGYSGGDPKSTDGTISFGKHNSAIFRFKPDGGAFEVLASTACNTWGFDFGWDGEMYYSTPTCGDHALHIALPEKVLARGSVGNIRAQNPMQDHNRVKPAVHHTRPAYVQIDVVGGFTAAAGSCLYNGGAWPERFNNTFFVSEPTVSLVHQDFLSPKGSSFNASKEPGREEVEFLTGSDLWFRPIHTRVGPDGAMYIVDFYNQAAIHNDTRGPKHGANNAATRPDRDHHFGRIWRVQHKEAKKLPAYNLNAKNTAELVKALDHPNGWVRMTAHRLLMEAAKPDLAKQLIAYTTSYPTAKYSEAGIIQAMWLDYLVGQPQFANLADRISDTRYPAVQKNALKIAAALAQDGVKDPEVLKPLPARAQQQIKSADARVKIEALVALQSLPVTAESARAVVVAYPELGDRYLESAAIGVAARDPVLFIETALAANSGTAHEAFVRHVVRLLALKGDAAQAAQLVVLLGKTPATGDALKKVALESLALNLKPGVLPSWNGELHTAFKALLSSANAGVSGAALPLVSRWDKSGALGSELKPLIAQLSAKLSDTSLSDDQRGQVAVNLIGVRQMDASILPSVVKILGPGNSPALQRRIIDALGGTPDAAAGDALVNAFPSLASELREPVFAQIIKRSDWSLALVQSVADKKIDLVTLGPASVHRLRTHADKGVAKRADEVITTLRGPEQQEKDKLIAQFLPVVEKPGKLDNGKVLFTQNCAVCHTFKNAGRNVAPDLTGMGIHGAHELLVHILDPNRVVEANYVAVSFETKDDNSYDGVIASENKTTVKIRNATGDLEIRQDNIKSRHSTGRSLMPEGFEALTAEGLRDIIAYISADDGKYRLLDLGSAFTADSRRGLYVTQESVGEGLSFKKFGIVKAGEVPFDIVNPTRTTSGNNVLVLRGGHGFAKTLPQKVEVKGGGIKATKLHFLGGVGGWAWPFGGDESKGLKVAKVTVQFTGGKSEEFILENGNEIADYNGVNEVPGSKLAPDLVNRGQVRWFTKPLKTPGAIQMITIESFNNAVAPTFVAITAETAETNATASK